MEDQGLCLFWLDQLQIPHGAIAKIRLVFAAWLLASSFNTTQQSW